MTTQSTQLIAVAGDGEIFTEDTAPRPGSRRDRMSMPLAKNVIKEIAENLGICTRPIPMRRTDITTGLTEIVDVPCNARLASKCKPCAEYNRRLRVQQIREGWHLAEEPEPAPERPHDDVLGLISTRAHLEFDREEATRMRIDGPKDEASQRRAAELQAIDEAINEVEEELSNCRVRGSAVERKETAAAVKRSTKRRADAVKLPKVPMSNRTTGRTFTARDGKVHQPSTFMTVTLGSHGDVHQMLRRGGHLAACKCGSLHGFGDPLVGTPINPDAYDYRQAALDAIHFAKALDRFWQNLRRAVGYQVQYAGSVELQRRLAPHAHFTVRGTMPRKLVNAVNEATYHQVWWPHFDRPVYSTDAPPVWDDIAEGYVDPKTGVPLWTWDDAILATTDEDATPACVVRLGRIDTKGINGGTKDAERSIRYVTKYIVKDLTETAAVTSDPQKAHFNRLHQELALLPCSPACANWLLYAVQPDGAKPGLVPGCCKGKVHQPRTLGFTGRRVLISRRWSGKTLTDHKYDRRAWVKAILGGALDNDDQGDAEPGRYSFERAKPGDPDIGSIRRRILRAIAEKQRHKAQLDQAKEQLTISATSPGEETRQ
jgi:hypothetical protein